jgi:hypothetical protein
LTVTCLLTELAETYSRFVVLPPHAEIALALWTVFTYVHDCFTHSPLLLLRSATKRCGENDGCGVARRTGTSLDFLVKPDARRDLPRGRSTPSNATHRRGGFVPQCERRAAAES